MGTGTISWPLPSVLELRYGCPPLLEGFSEAKTMALLKTMGSATMSGGKFLTC